MAAIRMQHFVQDWLDVARNGHRLTPTLKKRTKNVRRYWPFVNSVASNPPSITLVRWVGGNERTQIASYYFETDTVVINVDDHWGRQRGRRLRRDLCTILESLGQEYVLASFAACQIAGVQMPTIVRVSGELMSDQMVTKKEDTPRWLTHRVRHKQMFTYKKPTRKDVNAYGSIPHAWLGERDGVAGFHWWKTWHEEIPPDEDGFYRWSRHIRWDQPACVFKAEVARISRLDHRGIRKTVRFISALDQNDRPPRYFLSEIPAKGKAHTIDAALRSLAPPAVHLAWKQGRRVVRQGDVFAIKTDITEKELLTRATTRIKMREFYKRTFIPCETSGFSNHPHPASSSYARGFWHTAMGGSQWHNQRPSANHLEALALKAHYEDVASRLRVHGTAHSCTEIIKTTDGLIYGKGQIRHEPRLMGEQRERDHNNKKLDDGRDGWWLLVRNAVPPFN